MEPVEELRYLILGAQREGARTLGELLEDSGLTAARAEVLAVLRDADRPLSVREIGERLVCEGGSPSRLVSSLIDAGLVARGARDGDRRAVELSLTRTGRRAAQQVADVERELYDGLTDRLTARDIGAIVAGLRKLVADGPTAAALARRRDR